MQDGTNSPASPRANYSPMYGGVADNSAYYNYYNYPQSPYYNYNYQQQYLSSLASLTEIPTHNGAPCKSLYVGNLSDRVTEPLLYEIFACLGAVESAKICRDKITGQSLCYGFVEYYDARIAALALSQFNGRQIYGTEIKVNWATTTSSTGGSTTGSASSNPMGSEPKEDTSSHHHIFVGDLSPDVDDKYLFQLFSRFGSISDARIVMDPNKPGHSKGYGFVAFRKREDAQNALTEMNGERIMNRAIRCNWANQKGSGGGSSSSGDSDHPSLDYSTVFSQSSPMNCTAYVGNVTAEINESMLRSAFQDYGTIEEIRHQPEKGCAFIRFATHEEATRAIVGVHGKTIGGRLVKCSWGKEKYPPPSKTSYPPAPMMGGYPSYQQQPPQQQYQAYPTYQAPGSYY